MSIRENDCNININEIDHVKMKRIKELFVIKKERPVLDDDWKRQYESDNELGELLNTCNQAEFYLAMGYCFSN